MKITELRKRKNLTQTEFAEIMKVSQQCISSWETGTREPSVEQIKEISAVLECSIDELLS